MSATTAELSFAQMLEANERETAKWQNWFERQPADLLDLPLDIAQAKNVRELLLHIFAVEFRYAERLTGAPSRSTKRCQRAAWANCSASETRGSFIEDTLTVQPMMIWPP